MLVRFFEEYSFEDGGECISEEVSMNDHIDHAGRCDEFGSLEIFAELFADCLFDDASPCESDGGFGFCDVDVAEHGETRAHAACGGVCKEDDIREVMFFEFFDGDDGSWELQEGEGSFL